MMREKNKNNWRYFLLGIVITLAAGAGIPALAQVNAGDQIGATFGLGTADLLSTVIRIVQWALGLLGLVAVIIIMYGGFIWMTAGGNEEKIAKAKKILTRAIIGLLIILLAWAIVLFIVDRVSKLTGANGQVCDPGPPAETNGCYTCNGTGTGWVYTCGVPGADTFRVTWKDPGNGETNVPLCSIIQAKFNGNINPASVAGNAHLTVDGGRAAGQACATADQCASGVCTVTCQGAEVLGAWTIDDPKILEFDPDRDYLQNTRYRVVFDGAPGGITEQPPSTRIFTGESWWFTTGTTTISVPPTVAAINPGDGAANVCLNTPIQSVFSSKMRASSIHTGRCSVTKTTSCLLDTDCPGGETCQATVQLVRTPATPTALRSVSYPNVFSFSTRPLLQLDLGAPYTVTLVAGTLNTDYGIMDVCKNHLDGDADTASEGSAAGDDFLSVPSTNPTFPSEPWNFTADTDSTNNRCLPEITSVNPPDGRYDSTAPNVVISGSNFGIIGNVTYANGILDTGTCFSPNPPFAEYPNINCIPLGNWSPSSVTAHIPGGPINNGRVTPSNGAIDGPVVVTIDPGVCRGGANDTRSCNVPGDCPGGACETDSNAVSLDVASPQLRRVSGRNNQEHGGIGQYVTVSKRADTNAGFGGAVGQVVFRNRATGQELAGEFPPACPNTWRDASVVVKVPDLTTIGIPACPNADWNACKNTNSEAAVQVARADGRRSNLGVFVFTNEAVTPGLCNIQPDWCGSNNTQLTLQGENFRAYDAGNSRASFTRIITPPQPPVNAAIVAPPGANWTDQSINIRVPNLENDTYEVTVRNVLGTSNGLSPFDVPCGGVPRVVEDSTCSARCVGGTNAGNLCQNDSQCPGGTCAISMASPNPYKGRTDICLNSLIAARFSTAMVTGMFNATNIKLYECTNSTCTPPITEILGNTFQVFGPPFDERFIMTPSALNTGRYYKVTISREVTSTTGAKMNGDYSWIFKTKDDPGPCPVENIMVTPPSAVLINIPQNQSYLATPVGPSCSLLTPGPYAWTWSSDNPAVAAVTAQADPNDFQATATSVSRGATYINAEIVTESKKGRGYLKVDPESCSLSGRATYCADRDNNGINECASSVCDLALDRCTPVINSITPPANPAGSNVTVQGCYFRTQQGTVDIGGQAGLFQCTNPWSDKLVVFTTPASLPNGSHLVDIRTVDGLSTATDSGQTGAAYSFQVTPNCGRLCNPLLSPAYANAYCTSDAQCGGVPGSCPGVGAPVPASGVPGLCPPLVPASGREGTDITISGRNLLNALNTNNTRVYYTLGLADTYAALIGRPGQTWTPNKIEKSRVATGTTTGDVVVQVNNCPSNALPFGVTCSRNSDCTATNCCDQANHLCQNAGFCSTGSPGQVCQLPSNFSNNGTCGPPAPQVTNSDYRCIDTVGHRDPNAPAGATYAPPGDPSCRTCCYPGQINSGGLTCATNKYACSGAQRGLYCGCSTDTQCQNPPTTMGCAKNTTDKCCFGRPTISGTTPPSPLRCQNYSIRYTFNDPSTSGMDGDSFELGTSVLVRENGVDKPGTLLGSLSGFTFAPKDPWTRGATVEIRVRMDLVKSQSGIAASSIAGAENVRTWQIAAAARICMIDRLNFEWWSGGADYEPPPSLYTCATNNCEPPANPSNLDALGPPRGPGNERFWYVSPVDEADNQLVGNVQVTWDDVTNDPKGIFTASNVSGPPWGACPANQTNVFSCLLRSDNKSGTGYLTVTADGTASSFGNIGKVTQSAPVIGRLCSKSWPDEFAGDQAPFEDIAARPKPDTVTGANAFRTNFSIWYCADQDNLARLLPTNQVVIREGTPTSGNGTDELIKEYFFKRNGTSDAIGIRVYENEDRLSPAQWYRQQFGRAAPTPQSLTVDGYPAVRSGRSVYVAATNVVGATVYTNIYLISYNEGADSTTLEIYNRLLSNWEFNINIGADKPMLQRDMKRLNDLTDIYDKLLDYKGGHGFFPKLEGGTYVGTVSMSRWPSWQETFGAALGGNQPIDPINTFGLPDTGNLCREAGGYSQDTCWNEAQKQYQCPNNPGSYTYMYLVSPSGSAANLYANLEYAGPGNWRNLAPGSNPCAGLPNARCDCYNYQYNVAGSAADRQGPTINSVDSLVSSGTTIIQGTRALDVDAVDAGSGVARVEFFVDGTRTATDSDGSDGWSWTLDSTRYADGNHTIRVDAYDTVENLTSVSYSVSFNNTGGADSVDPFVQIVSHSNGDTVAGAAVAIGAHATDNRVVTSLRIDVLRAGVVIATPANVGGNTTATLDVSGIWDSTSVANGDYSFRATAVDSAGRSATVTVRIVVNNPDLVPPVVQITAPTDGATVTGAVDIVTRATDDKGMARVDFYVDGRFIGSDNVANNPDEYRLTWDTLTVTNGTHELTVYAFDAGGNYAIDPAAPVTVTIDNPAADVTPPTVVFIPPTPANGTSVDGIIIIAVDATDDRSIGEVNFYQDYLRRSTVTSAPWQWQVDTTTLSDGWHRFQVDAVDAAGNRSTSIEVRYNVRGPGGPSITNADATPCSGAPGTIFTYTATVTDPEGIALVQAVIRGPLPDTTEIARVTMTSSGGTDIYTGTWNSGGFSGAFSVDIEATDSLGNSSVLTNIGCGAGGSAVCGNGTIDIGEQCDTANLNGQTCVTRGFSGGTLSCNPPASPTPCTFNTSLCTASCVPRNGACTNSGQCCGTDWCNTVSGNRCTACQGTNVPCNDDSWCCSGDCRSVNGGAVRCQP